jgi:hypothetical protein
MSVLAMVVDKLRNYEYEKRGCEWAVGDIYALINHIATLEEEIAGLKDAAAPRTVERDGRGMPAGTVVIGNDGVAWQCDDGGFWNPAEFHKVMTDDHLEPEYGPYAVVYTPGTRGPLR